ncbi:MAG TPA: TonB-dependent receptor [Gemmatimonadales bacterium]|jgi:outer membrane receptor for ferrienterochelin and colicins|nr:TonB-dependent receptor [Gemmatimonadales bacterium]
MTLRWFGRPFGALLVALGVVLPVASAQRLGSITGTVRAADKGPVLEGARVVLVGTEHAVATSRNGTFTFHGLTPGKYVIQASAIGYATLSSPIEVKALETLLVEFETEPQSVKLPELETEARPNLPADFVRRRAEGLGRYFNRDVIEKRNPPTVGDLLRTVPGVRVECRGPICRVAMARAARNCPPAYFMDGVPVDASVVFLQPPRDLDGVEVYSGPAETPPELERFASCGAIVLWTRTPPPRVKKEKKPKPAALDSIRSPVPRRDTTSV